MSTQQIANRSRDFVTKGILSRHKKNYLQMMMSVLNRGLTMKFQKRFPINELVVYKTKNGKIISEQFFI